MNQSGRYFFWRVTLFLLVSLMLFIGASTALGRSQPTLQCILRLDGNAAAIDPGAETILPIRPNFHLDWLGDSLDSKIRVFNEQMNISGKVATRILFLAADGSMVHEVPNLQVRFYGNTLWSPDNQVLAFLATDQPDAPGPQTFVLAAKDGSSYRTLPLDVTEATRIDWSSDGAYVVIVHRQGILAIRTADLKVINILDHAPSFSPLWSPNGHKIAFTADPPNETLIVYDVDRERQNDIQIPPMEGSWISYEWSPDGQYILAARFTNAYSASWDIFHIEDGKPPVEMEPTDLPIYPTDTHSWAEDGHTLLWIDEQQALWAFDIATGQQSILIEDNVLNILHTRGRTVYIQRKNGKQWSLVAIDLDTRTMQTAEESVSLDWTRSPSGPSGMFWGVERIGNQIGVTAIDPEKLLVRRFIKNLPLGVTQVVRSRDSATFALLLGWSKNGLLLYDLETDSATRYPVDTNGIDITGVSNVLLSPDNHYLAVALTRSGNASLQLIDAKSKKLIAQQREFSQANMMWSVDSRKVLFMANDGVQLMRTDGSVAFTQYSGGNGNYTDWLPCNFLLRQPS